jgi:hypothetical protein
VGLHVVVHAVGLQALEHHDAFEVIAVVCHRVGGGRPGGKSVRARRAAER